MSKVFLFVAASIATITPKARANATAHALCSQTVFAEVGTKPATHLSNADWVKRLMELGFKQLGQSAYFRHPGAKDSVYMRLRRTREHGTQPVFYADFHPGRPFRYPPLLATPMRNGPLTVASLEQAGFKPALHAPGIYTWRTNDADFLRHHHLHPVTEQIPQTKLSASDAGEGNETGLYEDPETALILAEVEDGEVVRLLRPVQPFAKGMSRSILKIEKFEVFMGPRGAVRQEQVVHADLVLSDLTMKINYADKEPETIQYEWDPDLDITSISSVLVANIGLPLEPQDYPF